MEIDENLFQDENLTIDFQDMDGKYISYFVTRQHGPMHSKSWTNDTTQGGTLLFYNVSLLFPCNASKSYQVKTCNIRGKGTLRGIQ